MIKINNDAAVAICFALPALINKSIGLKKIPPPIPTLPDINPIEPPIKNEIILGIFYNFILSSKDLKFKSNKTPANIKTQKVKFQKTLYLLIKIHQ